MDSLFDTDDHIEIQVTQNIDQKVIAAYRHPDRTAGKHAVASLIETLHAGTPTTSVEPRRFGQALNAFAVPP